jgi:hypothetical protein
MRLNPRSRSTSAVVATGAAAVAALLVGATAVVAVPAAPAAAATPTQQQTAEPGPSLEPSPMPGCADTLVTFSRDGVVGDDRAVAITAQSLERDVDGWQLLAWQADAGTILTRVLATRADGELRELPPTTSGVVEHVLSLTFCGHHEGAQERTAEPPSAETTPPALDVTGAGDEPGGSRLGEAHHPASDDIDTRDAAVALVVKAGSDEQLRGAAGSDAVASGALPAGASPPQPTSEPARPDVGPLEVANPPSTAEGRTAPAPAIVPITLAVGAGPSAAPLDARPVAGPERDGDRVLGLLLAAAGGATAIAAGRRSAARRRAIAAAPAGHTPHEHMGVTR